MNINGFDFQSFSKVGHVVGTSGSGGLSHNQLTSGLGGSIGPGPLGSGVSSQVPLKLHSSKKRSQSDKKTCRWVLDSGTICGRTFSKFDSLRFSKRGQICLGSSDRPTPTLER